jgi:hypothetical protein
MGALKELDENGGILILGILFGLAVIVTYAPIIIKGVKIT